MVNIISLYLVMIMLTSCSSSLLLDKLRRQKAIAFVPELSTANQVAFDEGSPFRLTCAFLSNFDKLNVFWFHNGTVMQSFISTSISEEEDDSIESPYLVSTIVSTIEIEQAHFDMNGAYQCIAIHDDLTAQHSFDVSVKMHDANFIPTKFSEDAMITVHTYQTLFEPRSQTSLMCRVNHHEKDACTVRWFDPEDEPLDTLGEQTDLSLKNANFEDHMGLYKCQVCCGNQCRTLTSFVYPAGLDK
ncbi:unnamed protein product [Adineta ricciae]|uniref:Ig-like domain-containing protein n=1 Tax=Adineta ricciae TaxID=249248 RepID=A0A814Q2R5_ADIRI|nr:unnamed protein product [Adineta ricciae]CAF1189928.1 unnamed protein product [Adineta ricciae]